MGRFADEVTVHQAALEALREELARASAALHLDSAVHTGLRNTAERLNNANEAVEVLAVGANSNSKAVGDRLLEAATSLSDLQAVHRQLREALIVASGQHPKDAVEDADRDGDNRAKSRDARNKSKLKTPVNFSAFTRARWEAERLKGASMLAAADDSGDSGIKVWIHEMPKPFQEEKPCCQAKGRHVMVNTVEKVRKIYVEISVSGSVDRVGFIRGANLARFITLCAERSDCPYTAKKGGDLGWIAKNKVEGKNDLKINEVALATPKGACSPPFKSQQGFHLFFCEDRKG